MIPNAQQALALHKKYGSSERAITHCQACARITKVLVERAARQGKTVNADAAIAAALLHDIGRSQTQLVNHGYVGAKILEKEGVDRVVVEMVKRHVGAGISAEEAAALGFPPGDYVPRTLEEKFVCFADKMLDGEKARPFEQEVKRFVRKGHDVQRLMRLKEDVDEAVGEDAESLILRAPREHNVK